MTRSIYCALLLLFSLEVGASLKVFTCESEWAALTKTIGGDLVNVFSATSANQDPHFIEARPSLIARVRRADLLVCSGAGLEVGWLPLLLRKSANPRVQPGASGHFTATSHVSLLEKPTTLDRSQGDVHAAGNPHVHLDPDRMLIIGRALRDRMVQLLPESAAQLDSNFNNFEEKLTSMLERQSVEISKLAGTNIVVHHNSWVYLTDWLQLNQVATIEPKPGIPPTSNFLASLVRQLSAISVKHIIRAGYQNPRASKWLAGRIETPVRVLPYSPENWETEGALILWYQQILETLVLKGERE
ncbi:MAG TPA: zinc ABC transporter substrate-binding protein [Pseudomonadales bacterium]|jgi:zinc/manganese transport system substrate-binding protein|nr:zinc ABC transporter substrate-binding protein [Pseudomonadales bacterium]|tara:strand:- start:893 stop:1795 length:903 start_codon:yes stop_codon:yes gene_type:complete